MNPNDTLTDLNRRAELGGGDERLRRQHEAGKLTARERMELLFDAGSFEELDKLVVHRCRDFGMADQLVPGDGVVAGHGLVDGRQVFAFAQDFTVFGGSLSETNAAKIVKIMDLAMKLGCPIVGLNDSGGARIQEGVMSLGGYADIFLQEHAGVGRRAADLGDHGPVRGRRGLLAGHHRLHGDGQEHQLHVRDRSRRDQDRHARGGHEGRARRRDDAQRAERRRAFRRRPTIASASRSSAICCRSCRRTTWTIRRAGRRTTRPIARTRRSTGSCPPSPTQPYDILDLVHSIADEGYFLEVHQHYARNIVVGFARLDGRPVGIVANQPAVLAGTLDINASVKGARFVRFCDAFNIPLVTFEDVPGFLPGTVQEYGGIIRHGAKLLYAFAEATVPKVTVITRKAYGGAYCVMSSKHIRTDFNYAWPTAELAVMGPEGAVNILYKRELDEAADRIAARAEKVCGVPREVRQPVHRRIARASSTRSSSRAQTRRKLIAALRNLESKRDRNPPKKHGNIPL